MKIKNASELQTIYNKLYQLLKKSGISLLYHCLDNEIAVRTKDMIE